MDTSSSRPAVAPAPTRVATMADTTMATNQISTMGTAAQSPQPLSDAFSGRSPAESHGCFMGQNMLVQMMMDQPRFQSRQSRDMRHTATITTTPPVALAVAVSVAGIPKQDNEEGTTCRKRKAIPALSIINKQNNLKNPPTGLNTDTNQLAASASASAISIQQKEETKDNSCCICMSDPNPMEASVIDGCDHKFCFGCIEKWSERENTCPLCKERFYKIVRLHKAAKGKRGGAPKSKNTKKVKNRDQRADLNSGGNPLESMLAHMGSLSSGFPPSIARLIFSGLEPAGLPFPGGINLNAAGARQPEQRTESFSLPVPRVNARFEDNFMLSDDDPNSSEEERYSSFAQLMRSRQGPIFGGFVPSGEVSQRVETGSAFASDPRLTVDMQQRFRATLAAQYERSRAAAAANITAGTIHQPPAPTVNPRNFASNYLDVGAGNSAHSALEICASDSEDDDIQVVHVMTGRDV